MKTTPLTLETLPCGTVRTSATEYRGHRRFRGERSAGGVVSYQVSYDLAGLTWTTLGSRNISSGDFAATRAAIDAALLLP